MPHLIIRNNVQNMKIVRKKRQEDVRAVGSGGVYVACGGMQ